jgi:hypothetical protein
MMDGDFSSLRIDGGMFSPEFLQRVADASPELDGCTPGDYSTAEEGVSNLRDHLNYLWNRSIAVWDRFGPSGDEELPAARVKGFIQRLMRDIGLELTSLPKHDSSGERPQLAYDLGGALWHVVPSEVHLDQRSETIGTRRTSPHNLVQGELTSSEHHGWGLLTNGRQVRILRKTNRPSIQESLEFDIETMFNDRLYPDFCLFAMMVHGTRWSRNKDAPMNCWLETWYKASKEEGLSVLEDLRGCVQQAANALGTGLVRFQAGNQHLRDRLRSEAGLADELQREIMRYMYKLIFLFVMEDRNLLLRGNGEDLTPELETARERYMLGYSTQRHRSVVATTKGDEHHNFFEEVKLVISFLYKGEERLALPALGSYLFGNQSTEVIDGCTLLNTDFMKTLYHLCTFKKKDGPRQRVHWKTLRETELGSVYESLLELRPSIDLDNGTFTLVSEAGNDRKSSGSYYTPAELVDHLITTTIDPLLDEAKKKAKKDAESPEEYPHLAQEAILKLTVCDPACGSGHFLVAALERIAMELARIETGEHHPGISFIRKWKRLASSRCIYGVDLNPLAVELCKVAIWMDTYDGTNPLSFLDGHIRHGNSLLGQRLEKIGLIPDDAIPKAWVDQRKEHRKFNREQLKKAKKDAEGRLKKLQREYGERKKRAKQSGLGAFIEIPDDGRTDQELKQEIDQLKEAIEEKEAQKLLPPEIVWSTVDLPSVIADIAAQQAEVTMMDEDSLGQLEDKAAHLRRLKTDKRSRWAKEVLDASMAMWWWPEPDIDEHKQMMADPPVPLASFELNRYATWLAYQYGIEGDVLSNRATATHNFSNDETRFQLIRAHTERIADDQSFFHWELEFAEVFFGEE